MSTTKHIGKLGIVVAALLGGLFATGRARADEPSAESGNPGSGSFRPHFTGDVRALFLNRTDNNYFGHANTYAYSLDPGAGGIALNLGAELLPRVSLLASALYAINGADRDSAQLRLQSGAVLGMARWTFARVGDDNLHLDLALQGGFGRYVIKETYLDPAIAPQTYAKDDGAWGGTGGAQASFVFSGFLGVVGYGFHYAPASIADRIGGTVQAGGHELSFGIGVWL